MIRDFGIVWTERGLLLNGLANTAILSLVSVIGALLLGFVLTPALSRNRCPICGRPASVAPLAEWVAGQA